MNEVVTADQAAALFGLTVRRINQLAKPDDAGESVFHRLDCGGFDLYQAVPAYLKHKEKTGPAAEKLAAEAENLQIKARKGIREEQIEKRELYYAKDVRKVWRRLIAEMRSRNLEWLRRNMDRFDIKPMDREKEENAFVEFFNDLAEIEY